MKKIILLITLVFQSFSTYSQRLFDHKGGYNKTPLTEMEIKEVENIFYQYYYPIRSREKGNKQEELYIKDIRNLEGTDKNKMWIYVEKGIDSIIRYKDFEHIYIVYKNYDGLRMVHNKSKDTLYTFKELNKKYYPNDYRFLVYYDTAFGGSIGQLSGNIDRWYDGGYRLYKNEVIDYNFWVCNSIALFRTFMFKWFDGYESTNKKLPIDSLYSYILFENKSKLYNVGLQYTDGYKKDTVVPDRSYVARIYNKNPWQEMELIHYDFDTSLLTKEEQAICSVVRYSYNLNARVNYISDRYPKIKKVSYEELIKELQIDEYRRIDSLKIDNLMLSGKITRFGFCNLSTRYYERGQIENYLVFLKAEKKMYDSKKNVELYKKMRIPYTNSREYTNEFLKRNADIIKKNRNP